MFDEPNADTLEKMKSLNGILFPGGSGDYYWKSKFIVEEAQKINDQGTYFPLYGVCLGYQRMLKATSDFRANLLEDMLIKKENHPIHLTVDPKQTKMFKDMPAEDL